MILFTAHQNLLSKKLKLGLLLTLGITFLYYGLQFQVAGRAQYLAPTVVDHWIGEYPQAIWVYLSLFPLLIIIPLRFRDETAVDAWFRGMVLITVVSCLIFWVWPTAVNRPLQSPSWLHNLILTTDGDSNAFPSLHASLAVFNGVLNWKNETSLRHRLLIQIWAFAILWSTLATRQHVFPDIAAGSILGVVTGLVLTNDRVLNYLRVQFKEFRNV